MRKTKPEIRAVFIVITIIFALFLLLPMCFVLGRSFMTDGGGVGFGQYVRMLSSDGFLRCVGRSFLVAGVSGAITVMLAFILAYTVNNTNIPMWMKKAISAAAVFPMLLPTITYGFAIIYSFGKEGLITRLLGGSFHIYGFHGLVLGYVIYTLPIAFLLLNNTFKYIDKKFVVVSRVMGDNKMSTFLTTCIRPMLGTLGAAFIQSFFLSFTDFGIPAAIGGEFKVVATVLYNEMLGAVPNFSNGAVVAMVMLVPSVLSILLLNYLERYNFRYQVTSIVETEKGLGRDLFMGGLSSLILLSILSVFAVIVIIPFVDMWPYKITFTLSHIKGLFTDQSMLGIYLNSLLAAVLTALFGTLLAYGAALVTSRSKISGTCKRIIESIALVINTIPGMVLGIAFMLAFSATPLRNTFFLIVICNIIHFFSTPYLMMKNSLSKMNESWETTAMLMGDSWVKTIVRVVTPNAGYTIMEVLGYYFVNAMVTISAIIFIVGAHTMVITAKIKELQHYAKFDDIFALSLLLLVTNLSAKGLCSLLKKRKKK